MFHLICCLGFVVAGSCGGHVASGTAPSLVEVCPEPLCSSSVPTCAIRCRPQSVRPGSPSGSSRQYVRSREGFTVCSVSRRVLAEKGGCSPSAGHCCLLAETQGPGGLAGGPLVRVGRRWQERSQLLRGILDPAPRVSVQEKREAFTQPWTAVDPCPGMRGCFRPHGFLCSLEQEGYPAPLAQLSASARGEE